MTAAVDAKQPEATTVVTNFYDWYLAQHGNVNWYAPQHGHIDWNLALNHHTAKYFQARSFFHPILFGMLDDTYVKSIGDTTPPIDVSTTPSHDAENMSNFDPYVGASSPATSYRVGTPWASRVSVAERLREVTFVPVTFAFAHTRSQTQVTLIVRKNGSSYQIYDIHYAPITFYYAGPITDLMHFLAAYNC
jgi:hypothetical protein